jgi:hypothetical protein
MPARRTWVYVQQPEAYGIARHSCRRKGAVWSEFTGMLWCHHCQVDFVPKHNGVFDGPIPADTAAGLGFDFRRVSLRTKKLIKELSEPFIDCDGRKARVMRKRVETVCETGRAGRLHRHRRGA